MNKIPYLIRFCGWEEANSRGGKMNRNERDIVREEKDRVFDQEKYL